ncbi:MAG: lamin tail domain-containing protein, partial [Fibromonadaceae bacterium]|nr:lamin tail domain-containing protein [Fibromonadaceae bacterium]
MKKLTNMFVRARRALPLQIVVLILIIGVISCTDKSWPDEEDIASSSSGGILNISSGSVLDNSSSSGDSGSSSGSSSSGTGGPSSSSSAEALPIANLPVKFNEVFIASNWVELYNPADTAFNLRGYALINHAEGNLWFFDNATIQPRGYLTVFLSGTNAVRGDSIHLPFQLSRMGGDLYLMNSQREIADHIEYPAETLPTLSFSKNITTGQWALCRPTPNSQNSNECYNGQASVPTGLPPSGHYASGHSFILPAESSNGTIRCETNGNAPTANSPFQSGHQFNLTATTVLRCAQFRAGALPSEAIMRTYIIGRLPSLPIVSIAVDPWRMFDAPNQALYRSSTGNLNCGGGGGGFYTDSIVPIHLDFFESNADHKWSHGAEIKIHGGCSRMHPKKSVIIS